MTSRHEQPLRFRSHPADAADPSGVCHYLNLPREIRDIIHTYALTYEDGLVATSEPYRYGPGHFRWSPKLQPFQCSERPAEDHDGVTFKPGDCNPLRLVCHQTRAETRGLLLSLNDISFSLIPQGNSRWLDNSYERIFKDFYDDCSLINRNRLRKMTVHMSPDRARRRDFDQVRDILIWYTSTFSLHDNISIILRFNMDRFVCFNMENIKPKDYLRETRIWSMPRHEKFPDRPGARGRSMDTLPIYNSPVEFAPNVRFSIVEEFPEDVVRAQWRAACGKCAESGRKDAICTCVEGIAGSRRVFEEGL